MPFPSKPNFNFNAEESGCKAPRDKTSERPGVAPNVLEAALSYAAMGYPVLPLEPGGKRPHDVLGGRGYTQATTNRAILTAWFRARLNANLGIVPPEGVVVFDFDKRDELEAFLLRYKSLQEAPRSCTPRGAHVWAAVPAGVNLRSQSTIFLPRFEVKKPQKGYVLEYPSTISDFQYTWEVPLRPPKALPRVPSHLLSALTIKPWEYIHTGGVDPDQLDRILYWLSEEATPGNRHNALRTAVTLLVRLGAPPSYIELAKDLVLGRGLPAKEAEDVIRWVLENVGKGDKDGKFLA